MPSTSPTDEVSHICEAFKHQMLSIISALAVANSNNKNAAMQAWMTANQLAEYWQFVDEAGKCRTAGILKWTKRPSDQFPLPHAYMGDLMRFNREDVDRWAKEEAERRRIQNERKRLKLA